MSVHSWQVFLPPPPPKTCKRRRYRLTRKTTRTHTTHWPEHNSLGCPRSNKLTPDASTAPSQTRACRPELLSQALTSATLAGWRAEARARVRPVCACCLGCRGHYASGLRNVRDGAPSSLADDHPVQQERCILCSGGDTSQQPAARTGGRAQQRAGTAAGGHSTRGGGSQRHGRARQGHAWRSVAWAAHTMPHRVRHAVSPASRHHQHTHPPTWAAGGTVSRPRA
jgi:hypothetical protein